ncbi:MAG: pyruvate, water dikinase regulatory protein [bacterium]
MKDYIIFAASDGTAATARTVIQAVLAQFPDARVEVKMRPQLKTGEDIGQLIQKAKEEQGIIAYTLVSPELREILLGEARAAAVTAIDLLGPLLLRMEEFLEVPPRGMPGTFKPSSYGYDSRIEAINFTVDHDDGKNIHSVGQADIVILGISRTSKTPLSVYLAFRGWKVVNVPIIPGVEPFEILSRIDQKKIVGLTIEAEQLARIRKKRMEKFNLSVKDTYSDLKSIQKEISYAESIYQTPPVWPVIDVTHKSIEEIAQEVITALARRSIEGIGEGVGAGNSGEGIGGGFGAEENDEGSVEDSAGENAKGSAEDNAKENAKGAIKGEKHEGTAS